MNRLEKLVTLFCFCLVAVGLYFLYCCYTILPEGYSIYRAENTLLPDRGDNPAYDLAATYFILGVTLVFTGLIGWAFSTTFIRLAEAANTNKGRDKETEK